MATRADTTPYRRYPCTECPWKTETPPGQFPVERYALLASTAEQAPGEEPDFEAPWFACHKTPEGREEACAGWLASAGHRHLGVRLAVALGRLPAETTVPGDDWPELFTTYTDMATRQAQTGDGQ